MRVVIDKKGNIVTAFPADSFKMQILGSNLGLLIFGDTFIGQCVDFFNPLSDLQDILDIVND